MVGNTPLDAAPGLAAWSGLQELLLKREDLNPTGSHKDRGALVQVEACLEAGVSTAVISSSGNAALAAASYGTPRGLTVVALVAPATEPGKVQLLVDAGARVVVTEKPINHALRLSRVRGWCDLRPSLSPQALQGFRTLGDELATTLPPGVAIFGYASSGTTYQALGESLLEAGKPHELHPVQAGLVNGLSREFGRPGDGRRSVVGDLGVKVSPRTSVVVALVRESGGEAWWVSDGAINEAGEAFRASGIEVARECWAALAGVRTAAAAGVIGAACLVVTGRATPAARPQPGPPPAADFATVLERTADL